jgi:SpoVK/Ycf46/Vps4 family AAA+-type ATPase
MDGLGNTSTDSLQRDLARLNAFFDAERGVLLAEARRRRAQATEEQRQWVERPLEPKEVERRLEEGLEALMDHMDEETAAATARLVAILAATTPPSE